MTASCSSDPLGVQSIVGGYYLERVSDNQLPFVFSVSASERYSLLGESLYFDGKGVVSRTQGVRYENTETGQVRTDNTTVSANYRVNGDSIEIGRFSPCPINALCIANDAGLIEVGRLLVRSPRFGGPKELSYRKAIAID